MQILRMNTKNNEEVRGCVNGEGMENKEKHRIGKELVRKQQQEQSSRSSSSSNNNSGSSSSSSNNNSTSSNSNTSNNNSATKISLQNHEFH